MYSPSGIQTEPVYSSEQIWRSLDLHHLLTNEWVPLEWESKQLIKHHNNPQVTDTSPSVNVLWICMFLRNNFFFPLFFFLLKPFALVILSIILLSPVKKPLWTRREIWTDKSPFISENSPKQFICWWIWMWEDNRGWTHWKKSSINLPGVK